MYSNIDSLFSRMRWVNLIITILFLLVSIYLYTVLPKTIPTHISSEGVPIISPYFIDNYGSKFNIFIVPLIGGMVFSMFSSNWISMKFGKDMMVTFIIKLILLAVWLFFWISCGYYFMILANLI